MKKIASLFSVALLGCTLVNANFVSANMATTTQTKETVKQDLDDYIYGLKYNPLTVLTQNGEKIENIPPTQESFENGKFVVVQREKKSVSNNSADISVVDANANNVYAGAILRADRGLVNNSPAVVGVKRAPLTLSVDLPGMTNGESHTTVNNPTASGVRDGVNVLLDRWNAKYAKDYPNVAARIQYNETMAYSMDQLKTKFGASFEKLKLPLNIDFDAVHSGEKQIQIINFKQIYYNVNVDAPTKPSGFIASDVTKNQLVQKGITEATPPVYVSNVQYGRSMYIKLETASKSSQVKGAFEAAIKGVDIKNNTEYQDILKNTSFTAVILGGDANQATQVISGKIDDLKKIINQGANYNRENPGVPISYKTNFLKDNVAATIASNSDYIETSVTSYDSSNLTFDHTGGYVARFYVDWDEINYDAQGNKTLTHKQWIGSGQDTTAHWNQTLQIPANACNLHVVVKECTGLAWDWWRTIYDQSNLPLVGQRTISVWGTMLYPKVSDEVGEKQQ